HIYLVEVQTLFHLVLVACKDGGAVFQVGVDHPAVFPAAVFLDQGDGGVKVADGDQRLYAVLAALVKQAVVKGQALLVGGVVVPVGQDPGPGDGQPVALEARLGNQPDVLLVVVVQVDGLVRRVGGGA